MKVHNKFADWYRKAQVKLIDGIPEKRTEGISAILSNPTNDFLFDVIRLFFGKEIQSSDFEEKYHQYFNNADSTFGKSDNENEWRILAGISIGYGLTLETRKYSDILSLAVRCISFQGENNKVPIPDILNEVNDYLDNRALSLRSRETLQTVVVPRIDIKQELDVIKSIPANDASQAAAPLETINNKIIEKFSQLAKNVSNAINFQKEYIEAQDEELNIMWWVLGGFSRYDNSLLKEKSLEECCLRAAIELAQLTKLSIGPIASHAYLDNILQKIDSNYDNKQISLSAAIDDCNGDWKKYITSEYYTSPASSVDSAKDFFPIMYAIKRSVESGNSWCSGYSEAVGVDADKEFNPLKLSLQLYMEMLLIRLLFSDKQ